MSGFVEEAPMGIDDQMQGIKTRQELIGYLQSLQDPCDVVILAFERKEDRPSLGHPRVFACCKGGIPQAMYLCSFGHTLLLRESGI